MVQEDRRCQRSNQGYCWTYNFDSGYSDHFNMFQIYTHFDVSIWKYYRNFDLDYLARHALQLSFQKFKEKGTSKNA